ncbi:MAG TPA: tetratricopeptide repeat protein, partial [Thermoanaerobaculia bacterium]
MQAVLNGLTGAGLLIDGDRVSLLRADGVLSATPGRLSDLSHVLGEARNIDFMSVAGADEALGILRRNHLREESLDLALMLLDSDLSEVTRTEVAAVLNRELLDWDLRTWLEGVLYGAPLPAGADMDGALLYARVVEGNAVTAMLSRLSDLQSVIGRVHEAWTSVCARVLSLPAARNEATVLAARNGVFRHLVHASEGANYDEFRFIALSVLRAVADHRRIVDELIRELDLIPRNRRPAELAVAAEDGEPARVAADQDRKDGQYVSFDRTAAFENVKRQRDAIVNHMRAGRFDLVERYVNELIKHQLPLDHRAENTSKSLCNLAMEAKSLSLFKLQLELARRAVQVRYQDGWAWAQVGDASLILNRFEDALTAYRHASEFGNDLVGRTGYAQVLLTMDRLQESLATFEQVIRDYPTEIFAKNGRAEVLKSMGRLDEGLAAYDAIVLEFPNNVVAKNGRTEVLKSMGRLDEALAAYDAIAREFPNEVVAKTGRAEVLKSMGRLDEALEAYDTIGHEFPNNVVAKNGRAEVLKSMGSLDEALAAYDAIAREFPNEVVAKTGRAEVLKSMGRLDEALAAYDTLGHEFPNNVFAKNGRAEVLKSMGRLDEALEAYDAIAHEFPNNVVAKTGRAEVLKSMGRLDEAFDAYDAIAHEFPNDVVAKNG